MSEAAALTQELVIPAREIAHPKLGLSYSRPEYRVKMGEPTFTDRNYSGSLMHVPEGMRYSTCMEEMQPVVDIISHGGKPADVRNYVQETGRYTDGRYAWLWLADMLRIPEGNTKPREPDYMDEHGPVFVRTWILGEMEVGPVPVRASGVVPYSRNVFDVIDPVTGFPRLTTNDNKFLYPDNHIMHWWFDTVKQKVAVRRGSGWHRGDDRGCFAISANYGRSHAGFVCANASSDDGFRPVRGSFEVEVQEERTVKIK